MAIKRRKYLVKPNLQIRYLVLLALVIVIVAVLIGYSFLSALLSSPGMDQLSAGAVQNFISVFTSGFFWLTTIFLAIILTSSVFYIHRLIGPIYYFENVTDQMSSGDFSIRTHYRKKDETIILAKHLDKIAVNVKNAIIEDRKKLAIVREAVEAGNKEKAKELITEITQWFKI